jgi:hypothetical protein
MFHRVLLVVAGVLTGAGLSEVGLRLYFHDYEANRNYWGRYAFVADHTLPYRHAPSTTATAGREGSFGPHRITTNELGYRDHRVPAPKATAPRVVVAGASVAFGLGIENDDDLFHVQLERYLRGRPDCPSDVQVFNIAQTGFKLSEVCALAEQEIERFRPDLLLLIIHERDKSPFRDKRPDLFDGYRLDRGRRLAGTWFDYVRTRCYLWMRLPRLSSLLRGTELKHLLSFIGRLRRQIRPGADETSSAYTQVTELVAGFRNKLLGRGVDLMCVVVYRPDPASLALSDRLRQTGLMVVDIVPEPSWQLPLEGHWNTLGHRMAAEHVAGRIPCTCFADDQSPGTP